MQRGFVAKLLSLALAFSVPFTAQASTIWDEAISGDLSNDGLAPTSLVLADVSNRVVGTTGNAGQGIDRDYFSVIVPFGMTLTSITLLDNTNVSGGASFIAMQLGPQLTVSPTGAGVENLLGFLHYDNSQVGKNLLPFLAASYPGGLPSGTYSLWVQETGGPATYGFDFGLAPVPLPSAALLLFSGLLALGTLRLTAMRRLGSAG